MVRAGKERAHCTPVSDQSVRPNWKSTEESPVRQQSSSPVDQDVRISSSQQETGEALEIDDNFFNELGDNDVHDYLDNEPLALLTATETLRAAGYVVTRPVTAQARDVPNVQPPSSRPDPSQVSTSSRPAPSCGTNLACSKCTRRPSTAKRLVKHMNKHHKNSKGYRCNTCQRRFPRDKDLREHLETARAADAHQAASATLASSWSPAAPAVTTLPPALAIRPASLRTESTATNVDNTVRDSTSKEPTWFRCKCGPFKIFRTLQGLLSHRVRCHKHEPFKCDMCDQVFDSRAELRVHLTQDAPDHMRLVSITASQPLGPSGPVGVSSPAPAHMLSLPTPPPPPPTAPVLGSAEVPIDLDVKQEPEFDMLDTDDEEHQSPGLSKVSQYFVQISFSQALVLN